MFHFLKSDMKTHSALVVGRPVITFSSPPSYTGNLLLRLGKRLVILLSREGSMQPSRSHHRHSVHQCAFSVISKNSCVSDIELCG